MIRDWVKPGWLRPPSLRQRILSLFDTLAERPVWRRPLLVYLLGSSLLWTAAGLIHRQHGVVAASSLVAIAAPLVIFGHSVTSAVREILTSPPYFLALTCVLLVLSRLTPGRRVSFGQLFSVTVHVGYVLLLGHALRVALSASGVELAGPAATLLPDPNAMFLPDPTGPTAPDHHSISFSAFPRSPTDVPAVGLFDAGFHALLGVGYCHIRGRRLAAGAAWGAGLSLLADILWFLLGADG